MLKLTDFGFLYKVWLQQLGATVGHQIHTTRLKNRLLSVFPDLRAHSPGRDTLLMFQEVIGAAIKKGCGHDSDAILLLRAADVVHREMFDTKFTFDGSFHTSCQKECSVISFGPGEYDP